MKTIKLLLIFCFLVSNISAKDIGHEALCINEIKKQKPNLEIVKKECLQTAKIYENIKWYGGAGLFYLYSHNNDKNIENYHNFEIEDMFVATIALSYVIKGDFAQAKKIYLIYLKEEEMPLSDKFIQDYFDILFRLYPHHQNNLKRGLALWTEIYKPLKKINTIYPKYEQAIKIKNYKKAIKYLDQIINIQSKSNLDLQKKITKNLNTKKSLYESLAYQYNLQAMEYNHKNDYKTALLFFNKSLEVYQDRLDDNLTIVATLYSNIGYTYQEQKDLKNAIKYYKKSLKLNNKIPTPNYNIIAKMNYYIGLMYKEEKEYENALKYLKKSLTIKEKILGKEHKSTKRVYSHIGIIYHLLGEDKKALEYYKK
jgi:tetratricopeptide (TPR) repeat protein